MNSVHWYKNKYFYTATSIIALVIYGFVVYAAPAVTYNPGETLDPTDPNCHTDNTCVVTIPGATIGGSVIGGTPNQVLYTDANGNVTGDDLFSRASDQTSFNVTSNLANSETGSFYQGDNALGLGLSGTGTLFQTASPGVNVFMAIDTSPFGGQIDSTFTGYFNPFGAGNANIQTRHDNGASQVQMVAQDDTGTHHAQISLGADSGASDINFEFDTGSNYSFPATNPSAGEVLGYVSANQLGWVTPSGGGGGGSYVPLSDKAAANGVATLDSNGKIPTSQLSALAINNTYVVSSQVDMLALSAHTGDVAVRTDENKTYILSVDDPTTLSNWVEVLTSSNVISVNGQTGSVNLTTGDIAESSNLYFTTGRVDSEIVSYLTGLSGYANGKILKTDGAGSFSWTTDQTGGGGGGGSISISNTVLGSMPNEILYTDSLGLLNQSPAFTFDGNMQIFKVGTSFGTSIKSFDGGGMGNLVQIGDVPGTKNKTLFSVADGSKTITATTDGDFIIGAATGGAQWFDANVLNTIISLGDLGATQNRTKFVVDDANKEIFSYAPLGAVSLGDVGGSGNGTNFGVVDSLHEIDMQAVTTQIIDHNGNKMFRAYDNANYPRIESGDIDNAHNGTIFTVNDFAQKITMNGGGGATWGLFDSFNHKVVLGDSNSLMNSTSFSVNDVGGTVTASGKVYGVVGVGLNLDFGNDIYELGQISGGTANHTKFTIDDNFSKITSTSAIYNVQNQSGDVLIHAENVTGPMVNLGDVSNSAHRTKFLVNDTNQNVAINADHNFEVKDTSGNRWFVANTASIESYISQIGDIDNHVNGTKLVVGAAGQTISFQYGVSGGYTFPIGDGTAGQFLATNGSGQIAWTSPFVTVSVADNNIFTPSIGGGASLAGGQGDILLGLNAGHLITTAGNTVAIGSHAGETGTINGANVLIGNQAGQQLTGGNSVMIGHGAGAFTQSPFSNVFVGYLAGVNNIGGSNNMFLGSNAGVTNVSGSYNVAIGDNAGITSSSGSSNLFLGSNSGVDTNGWSSSIALGREATITKSHQMVIGSTGYWIDEISMVSSGGASCAQNINGLVCSSDARLKKNITDLDTNVLDTLTKVKTVTFNWKDGNDTANHIGFIAQDMQQYYPELVSTASNGYLQVNYAGITPVLVEAIRELNIKMDNVDAQASAMIANETFIVGLRSWFASETNAITLIISDTVKARNEICIDDVCMNKDQLKQVLESQNQGSGAVPQAPVNPTPAPTDPVTVPVTNPAPDPVIDPTPAPVTDPVPTLDPVPVVDPAPAVTQ